MSIQFRQIRSEDKEALFAYFEQLSPATRQRFGPHPFDEATAAAVCEGNFHNAFAYVAVKDQVIIAYALVQAGYVRGDYHRYQQYEVEMNEAHDCTLAPSVADAYQSHGIGSRLYQFLEAEIRAKGVKKIILWGGVQLSNQRAVRYYLKHGFRTLAQFEHNGVNLDMMKQLEN